jgi:hypothetical protein
MAATREKKYRIPEAPGLRVFELLRLAVFENQLILENGNPSQRTPGLWESMSRFR